MEEANIYKMIHEASVEKWVSSNSEFTYRYAYDQLTTYSRVVDIGGYKGDFANIINHLHKCAVEIYEPYSEFAHHCSRRFIDNDYISVYPFGLLDVPKNDSMEVQGSATKRGDGENCRFESIDSIFHSGKPIDLMKINVEGDEFPIINRMIETGDIVSVRNLQVQVHWFVDNVGEKYKKLEAALSITHERSYYFPYCWENWTIREPNPKTESDYLNELLTHKNTIIAIQDYARQSTGRGKKKGYE